MLQLPWENHKYILSRHDNSIHPGYLGLRLTGGAAQILKIQFLRDFNLTPWEGLWHKIAKYNPNFQYRTSSILLFYVKIDTLRGTNFQKCGEMTPCEGHIFKIMLNLYHLRDYFFKRRQKIPCEGLPEVKKDTIKGGMSRQLYGSTHYMLKGVGY